MAKGTNNEKIDIEPSSEESNQPKIISTKKSRNFSPKNLIAVIKRHPRRTALAIFLLVVIIFAVPMTRYPILGLAIKKPVSFKLTDSQTGAPISEATVSVRGQEAKTDNEGVAKLSKVPVGKAQVTVTKKYYETANFGSFVGLKTTPEVEHKLVAQGRSIKVRIANKVSGKAIENAVIKLADEEYKVDKSGETQVIIPGNATDADATIKRDGFNELKVKVVASDTDKVDDKNIFKLTPSGKLYFLSKASGKIDVVKTNLDGTDRKVVLAGTGKEEDGDTILLASRDWKYAALKSRRDSDKAKIYLIDTATDKLTTIDEGNASFTLTGWHNEFFIYSVDRLAPGTSLFQPKRYALKSFNAQSAALKTIDESGAGGSNTFDCIYESINNIYILPGLVSYTKDWSRCSSYNDLAGKADTIYAVDPSGNNKRKLHEFPVLAAGQSAYLSARAYALDEIAYQRSGSGQTPSYFELEDGKVIPAPSFNADTFNKFYPTYIVSPSAKQTLWYEPRDGKNTLFVGDDKGKNGKQIATLSELVPYGWYSDEYLLVSKGGSELFIIPVAGLADATQALKVTDYHKPDYNFAGYGYGYGGF